MRSPQEESGSFRSTPLQAVALGAASGLAGALLLSALSRVAPGMWNRRGEERERQAPPVLPEDPFDPRQVQEWQARSQSPAADRPRNGDQRSVYAAPRRNFTPAETLAEPQSPGPEGLAEQFALKVGSGVFARDLKPVIRPLGVATHLLYGSFWGSLYGVTEPSFRWNPSISGPLFGLAVYGVGPAFLVPAMKLMGTPMEEPPRRTAMLVVGHALYGLAVAGTFRALEGSGERGKR